MYIMVKTELLLADTPSCHYTRFSSTDLGSGGATDPVLQVMLLLLVIIIIIS